MTAITSPQAGHVVEARDLMRRSRAERFAVGALNADNQETLIAIARAAQAKQAPVLAEVSQGEVDVIGLGNLRSSSTRRRGPALWSRATTHYFGGSSTVHTEDID